MTFDEALERAYSTGREYAWKREDVADAVEAIRQSGRAVDWWEVWLRHERGHHTFIPSADGGPPGVLTVYTDDRKQDESWAAYCDRTAAEALAGIAKHNVESWADPAALDDVLYNIAFDSGGAV